MNVISLKYQTAIFGNYDDIAPNIDNIKYFIEVFADKGLIPSQFKEYSLNISNNTVKNSDSSRLSLTSTDGMWNITFNVDRIDFFLTNNNIGKVVMPSFDFFITEVQDILSKVTNRFPKKHKRIGLIAQWILEGIESNESSKKLNKTASFFNEKGVRQWSNKISTRTTLPNSEIINVVNQFQWAKTNLKREDNNVSFEGLSLTIDTNTINENQNYRFSSENLPVLLKEMSKITEILQKENLEILA